MIEDKRGKEGPANCKAIMSTSWKVKNKEERVRKKGGGGMQFKIYNNKMK